MAYYVALSFFPLLMILVAGLSVAMAGTPAGQDVQRRLLAVVQQQTSPVLSEQIEAALATINRCALSGGPVGFLLSTRHFSRDFHPIRVGVRSNLVDAGRSRSELEDVDWRNAADVKALAVLIGVGLFFIVAIIASVSWAAVQASIDIPQHDHPAIRWLLALPTTVGLHCIAFTIVYRMIPKAVVPWRFALQGGILAALMWEVGRELLSIYLLGGSNISAYGIIGSFIAIMLWAYYAMMVIFYGRRVRTRCQRAAAVSINALGEQKGRKALCSRPCGHQ